MVTPPGAPIAKGEKIDIETIALADDGVTTTYTFENLPPGLTGNVKTGKITGIVAANATGNYDVVVEREQAFRLTVGVLVI